MRLKSEVGPYIISTVAVEFVEGITEPFETVVFSDDERVHLRNGELVISRSSTPYAAQLCHQLAVDWVRAHAHEKLDKVRLPGQAYA